MNNTAAIDFLTFIRALLTSAQTVTTRLKILPKLQDGRIAELQKRSNGIKTAKAD
jgi:hypothetical protein